MAIARPGHAILPVCFSRGATADLAALQRPFNYLHYANNSEKRQQPGARQIAHVEVMRRM